MIFSWTMENALRRAPGRPQPPQTIVITSKFIGPGGVRSDRKSRKPPEIIFPILFAIFLPESWKWMNCSIFGWSLLKGGPWAALLPDHCSPEGLSRFLSLQNTGSCSEMVNFMTFLEIPWNFMILHDFHLLFMFLRDFFPFLFSGVFGALPGGLKTLIFL